MDRDRKRPRSITLSRIPQPPQSTKKLKSEHESVVKPAPEPEPMPPEAKSEEKKIAVVEQPATLGDVRMLLVSLKRDRDALNHKIEGLEIQLQTLLGISDSTPSILPQPQPQIPPPISVPFVAEVPIAAIPTSPTILMSSTPMDHDLYVANLPKDITEEQIRHIFEQFGNITKFKMLFDKTNGQFSGVAFIRYASLEEGTQAMKRMHNTKIHPDLVERINVTIAERGKNNATRSQQQQIPRLGFGPTPYPPSATHYQTVAPQEEYMIPLNQPTPQQQELQQLLEQQNSVEHPHFTPDQLNAYAAATTAEH